MRAQYPVLFILITLTLDAIGFGLIMPVMPDLLREVTGGDLARAALWGGVLTGGFAVMQLLFGPVIGNLGDRFGRKPVLLASLAVLSGDYLVLALAGSVWVIFGARLVTGAGLVDLWHGLRLSGRHLDTRTEGAAVRADRCGLWCGLRPGTGDRRAAGGIRHCARPLSRPRVVAGANLVFGVTGDARITDRQPAPSF